MRDAYLDGRRVHNGGRWRSGLQLGVVAVLATAGAWALTPGADARSANLQREARIELGRRLFLDPVASRGGQFSCASCHEPEHGFSDPRQLSVDENGATARHSQPTLDLAGDGFHWDGEFDTVEQLLVARLDMAQAALEQTVELLDTRIAAADASGGTVDRGTYDTRRAISRPPYYGKRGPRPTSGPPVVARLELDGRYEEGFLRAYGSRQVLPERVVDAVAMYLDTLRTTENDYDRHRQGDADALSESARRGLHLFEGTAACSTCHVTTSNELASGKRARTLSDGRFHDTGVAYRGGTEPVLGSILPQAQFTLFAPRDVGRAGQTFRPDVDRASFKTPSLRDVATRAPYMHDGSFETLTDVVDYYNRGGTPHDGLDEAVHPLHLTAQQKADLVAFLESLTGHERPGLGAKPRYRPDTTRVQIRDLRGEPLAKQTVRIIPAGDRLLGTEAMPATTQVVTDEWGRFEFEFPLSTQIRLETDDHEIGLSRLLPDWSRKLELVATPLDTVSVVVRRSVTAGLPDRITLQPTFADSRTTDARIYLDRVTRIDADTSLYAASRESVLEMLQTPRAGVIDVRTMISGQPSLTFAFDTRGGQSDPLDLRRDATTPIGAPGVRDPRATSKAGGSLPPRPRGRGGPRDTGRDLPEVDSGGMTGSGATGGGASGR